MCTVRVAQAGTTSIRYEVGLFRNDDDQVSAAGHFVHVYVGRSNNKPTALPENLRTVVTALLVPAEGSAS